MPLHFLEQPRAEVVFALVSAVGTDQDRVESLLRNRLEKTFNYELKVRRLSDALSNMAHGVPLKDTPEYERISTRMKAGNKVREDAERFDLLVIRTLSDISESRTIDADQRREPLPGTAWLLRSLKRPEEVETLRKVYGPGFFVIGAFSPREDRKKHLEAMMTPAEAEDLLDRDEAEEEQKYGQRTSKTFQLADVFLDLTRCEVEDDLNRFLDLVFGDPFETPTFDEYAMFLAYAASLRSADLSRQVGAVVVSCDDEIVSVGANDVPAPGGGLYWPGPTDQRDHIQGKDSNEEQREEILDELLGRLEDALKAGGLSVAQAREKLEGCRVLDITEFGRAVHAEMEAILSAGRSGVSMIEGTLYGTTFPCHNCAKHIVAAGLTRVVYIEPYPKSLAELLHEDSISFGKEARAKDGDEKVHFAPFVGIGPRRFFDLFSLTLGSGRAIKRKKKDARGEKVAWEPRGAELRIPLSPLNYMQREELAAKELQKAIGD